jgi:hypothetical protein
MRRTIITTKNRIMTRSFGSFGLGLELIENHLCRKKNKYTFFSSFISWMIQDLFSYLREVGGFVQLVIVGTLSAIIDPLTSLNCCLS